MDEKRKKELKFQYKEMRPEMGIFIIRSKINNKCYVETTQNLKSKINGTKFKLKLGNHPDKGLQKEWNEQGKENFIIEILEKLEFDKDESKTDYSEELDLLEMLWKEKLLKQMLNFY
jgi:hypothetical protein